MTAVGYERPHALDVPLAVARHKKIMLTKKPASFARSMTLIECSLLRVVSKTKSAFAAINWLMRVIAIRPALRQALLDFIRVHEIAGGTILFIYEGFTGAVATRQNRAYRLWHGELTGRSLLPAYTEVCPQKRALHVTKLANFGSRRERGRRGRVIKRLYFDGWLPGRNDAEDFAALFSVGTDFLDSFPSFFERFQQHSTLLVQSETTLAAFGRNSFVFDCAINVRIDLLFRRP